MNAPESEMRDRAQVAFRILILICLPAAVLLRVLFLSSDPYPGLDWSSGLLTDESFYAHNARNLVLFGRARMDEFNNMLLSPLVHFAQWGVFNSFGAGFVETRALAVSASLASLLIFVAALNRAFGLRTAGIGGLFLGLDHIYLLYSRMSLLDTYAVLPSVAAFYCFVRSRETQGASRPIWFGACGALLAVAVTNRSLCLYLVPAPLIALWGSDYRLRDLVPVYAGFAAGAVVYLAVWYLPNGPEMAHMTNYYRTVQLQPKSPEHLGSTIYHNLLGDRRGLSPYLFRHSPVLLMLALTGLAYALRRRPETNRPEGGKRAAARFLAAWLISGWALLFILGYSPSRYYVTTYPALCAIAALTLGRIERVWTWITSRSSRFVLTGLTWYFVYHLVESIVHRGGVFGQALTAALLYGLPTIAAAWVGLLRPLAEFRPSPRLLAGWAIAAWTIINIGWLGHWLFTLRWSQRDISAWMRRSLPSGSIAVGDVAAGLGLGLPFQTVNVIPGLCNYRSPLEGFGGSPRYIVILNGSWTRGYWQERYWHYVAPARAIHKERVLKWDVAVYPVLEPIGSATSEGGTQ